MVIGTPFKPGQSGNPSGRPKSKLFKEAIMRAITEAGDDRKRLDIIAAALLTKAAEGDIPAIKELADRIDGKVPQGIIGGEEGDEPVKMIITGVPRAGD